MLVALVFLAGVGLRLWFVLAGQPGFLGFTDSASYVSVAAGGGSPARPIGYPIFLKAVHVVTADMTWTVVAQHALGVGTAALAYLAALRMTSSRLVALVPAAVLLFDGLVLVLEHTLLTETLFSFLVAASTYAALCSLDGGLGWAAGAGFLAAAAGVTRSVGLFVIAVPIAAALLWSSRPRKGRLGGAALAAAGAFGAIVVYLGVLAAAPGDPQVTLTPSSGRILYSRAATFADCTEFSPPAATRALCERAPPALRQGTNFYLWDPRSPGWRTFGPPPAADGTLRAFALAAMRHQLGDYLSGVWEDLSRYGARNHGYTDLADDDVPEVRHATSRYYRDARAMSSEDAAPLLAYSRTVFTAGGWSMVLLILLPALSLVAARGRQRHGAAIYAGTGWCLLTCAVLTTNYDRRYAAVALGSLATASAPALAISAARLRAVGRRLEAGRTSRTS